MAYLIDTNIAIYARDGNSAVLQKISKNEGAVAMSALSLAELERGVRKIGSHSELRGMRLQVLLRVVPVISFDAEAAEIYGNIIAQCGWVKGRDFDRMIAAHAIRTSSILVTDNLADFRDIPALTVENWFAEDVNGS